MPAEAIYDDRFSIKSDVYAYGMMTWEIYSFGEFPIKKFSDRTVLDKIRNNDLNLTANKLAPKPIRDLQVLTRPVETSEPASVFKLICSLQCYSVFRVKFSYSDVISRHFV